MKTLTQVLTATGPNKIYNPTIIKVESKWRTEYLRALSKYSRMKAVECEENIWVVSTPDEAAQYEHHDFWHRYTWGVTDRVLVGWDPIYNGYHAFNSKPVLRAGEDWPEGWVVVKYWENHWGGYGGTGSRTSGHLEVTDEFVKNGKAELTVLTKQTDESMVVYLDHGLYGWMEVFTSIEAAQAAHPDTLGTVTKEIYSTGEGWS